MCVPKQPTERGKNPGRQSCFTRATRAYAANPSTVTLMLLNRSAVSLLAADAPPPIPFDRKWTDIYAAVAGE